MSKKKYKVIGGRKYCYSCGKLNKLEYQGTFDVDTGQEEVILKCKNDKCLTHQENKNINSVCKHPNMKRGWNLWRGGWEKCPDCGYDFGSNDIWGA